MSSYLSFIDIAALAPLLILLFGALVILLMESFSEDFTKVWAVSLTLVTISLATFAAYEAPVSTNELLTPWLRFDPLSRFFTLFFLVIGFAVTLLSYSFFKTFEASHGEYFFLLLSALFGLILIGASADFLTLFLGLETLSISLYILCGYMKQWEVSHEAAIKYFLIGALAASFLIYGIALIYGAVGSTSFDGLLKGYQALSTSSNQALFYSGIALVTLGLAFKAAIVPFHQWAPDVYDGAPTPVTAFMAVGTKVGAFAAFVRIFFDALPHFDPIWNQSVTLLVYPTLIYANLVALRQTQLRRFFAYSGISHAGFLLIPLIAATPDALMAINFYLIVYAAATLGCFAVLAFLDHNKEGVMISDLSGLYQQSPFLSAVLTLCILTLAGIPPTAGFFAKFFLFKTAFQAKEYALVIAALLITVVGAFYYLRIIAIMFSQLPAKEKPPLLSWPAATVGLLSCAAIVYLSINPTPFITMIDVARR